MFAAVPQSPARESVKREPLVMARCTCELWEGVRCVLPAGHQGSHYRPASGEGCELRWRSSLRSTVR
jgi:hypothetical protein